MVDSNDPERVKEAAAELDSVKTGDTPKLSRLQHKESFNGAAKLRTKEADQATPKDEETKR